MTTNAAFGALARAPYSCNYFNPSGYGACHGRYQNRPLRRQRSGALGQRFCRPRVGDEVKYPREEPMFIAANDREISDFIARSLEDVLDKSNTAVNFSKAGLQADLRSRLSLRATPLQRRSSRHGETAQANPKPARRRAFKNWPQTSTDMRATRQISIRSRAV